MTFFVIFFFVHLPLKQSYYKILEIINNIYNNVFWKENNERNIYVEVLVSLFFINPHNFIYFQHTFNIFLKWLFSYSIFSLDRWINGCNFNLVRWRKNIFVRATWHKSWMKSCTYSSYWYQIIDLFVLVFLFWKTIHFFFQYC